MTSQTFFQSNADPTKKLALDIDGLTTSNTRTLTLPDQDIDFGISGMTTVTAASGDFVMVRDATDGQLKKVDALDFLAAGAVTFKGDWDASAGTFPGGGTASLGDMYVVSVAGTVDGVTFGVGDSVYAKVDNASTGTFAANWVQVNASDAVNSVFGRTGTVVAASGDYNAGQITFTPAGTIAATTVQAAIEEVAAEAATKTLADGDIFIGNGSNEATARTLSGDITITNTGVATVAAASDTAAGKVELATAAETLAVTATDRAVTPASLSNLIFSTTTRETYSVTNHTTLRTLDRNDFTVQDLCDAFNSLVTDLKTRGVVL